MDQVFFVCNKSGQLFKLDALSSNFLYMYVSVWFYVLTQKWLTEEMPIQSPKVWTQ